MGGGYPWVTRQGRQSGQVDGDAPAGAQERHHSPDSWRRLGALEGGKASCGGRLPLVTRGQSLLSGKAGGKALGQPPGRRRDS